jgi:AcrR family transcriptional regulator
MGRKRQFEREQVACTAMAVFWDKGFAETSLHDLEVATGVNKSGLYTEFRGKADLYLAALRYYLANRGTAAILSAEPLGRDNLRHFLEIPEIGMNGRHGCFKINAMRELSILPAEAAELIAASQRRVEQLVIRNIEAGFPKADAPAAAEVTMTFFSGLCLERNLWLDPDVARSKVTRFLELLERA